MNTTESAGDVLFRFVQLNDLHVQSDTAAAFASKTYARATDKARWAIDAIAGQKFGPTPDFVTVIGDLIHGESLEALVPDLEFVRELLAPLPCPVYPLVGNHEVMQQERSAEHLRAYKEVFGQDRADYTFTHGGVTFIALNNSGAPVTEGAERNQWLQAVLNESRDAPKIILCHIPLIPLRDDAVLEESFGFCSYYDTDPGTLALIEAHASTVIAVLSGHLHLTGVKQQKGIYHIVASGTASYPSDAAVSYDVYRDRIEVQVHELPGDLANAAPTIHGVPRYPHDFTDSDHPTADQYQRGRDDERRFVIPLTGSKRM